MKPYTRLLKIKYPYDAEGRRVNKATAAASVDYFYDPAGHVMTEFNSTGAWNRGEVYAGGKHLATYSGGTSGTTYFIHADWLGTERVRSTYAGPSNPGVACETVTSLPFGDGQATSGSCGDASPLHFTGKQRDTETGNDDFGARYYASSMGRWMSPDWSEAPVPVPYAHLTNPQTLNLYAMVADNPVTFADLDGHGTPGATPSPTSASCPGAGSTTTGGESCSNPENTQGATGDTKTAPTQQEIVNELNRLADAYGVPRPLLLAVAQTESSLNVGAVHENKDKQGKTTSTDYGLMQIDSTNIGKTVNGPDGKTFKISDEIKTDWKANANAGAALLAKEYKAAVRDQPNGNAQSRAQQTYSGYNGGPGQRQRYLQRTPDGKFSDKRDQHFLSNYNAASN